MPKTHPHLDEDNANKLIARVVEARDNWVKGYITRGEWDGLMLELKIALTGIEPDGIFVLSGLPPRGHPEESCWKDGVFYGSRKNQEQSLNEEGIDLSDIPEIQDFSNSRKNPYVDKEWFKKEGIKIKIIDDKK